MFYRNIFIDLDIMTSYMYTIIATKHFNILVQVKIWASQNQVDVINAVLTSAP